MNKTVFSNTRNLINQTFDLDLSLKIDNTLIMDGKEFLSKLPDSSIPLVFFDPQYRSVMDKQKYGNEGKRQKERSLLPQMSNSLINDFVIEIERILMPSGHLMMWMDKYLLCNQIPYYYLLILDLTKQTKSALNPVDMVVWNKKRIGMGYRTRRTSEYLVILQKTPIRAKGVWQLHNIPDVWDEKANKTHTHAKPIGLTEQLILAVTNENDIVVDPCAGGYGVMKAAHNTKRRFLGCDIMETKC